MNIAGNRWINLALNLSIALTILVIIVIFLTGGMDVRIGGHIPRIGGVKFTCHGNVETCYLSAHSPPAQGNSRPPGDATAFWAAVVLAFYPPHIELSRVTHIDSTLTLFFMSSILCYLMYAQQPRLRWNVASAIFFGLALLTKTPAYLLPLILLAWKISVRLYDRRQKSRFWDAGDLLWLGLGVDRVTVLKR
jgi:hypothetical protein